MTYGMSMYNVNVISLIFNFELLNLNYGDYAAFQAYIIEIATAWNFLNIAVSSMLFKQCISSVSRYCNEVFIEIILLSRLLLHFMFQCSDRGDSRRSLIIVISSALTSSRLRFERWHARYVVAILFGCCSHLKSVDPLSILPLSCFEDTNGVRNHNRPAVCALYEYCKRAKPCKNKKNRKLH